MADAVKKIYPDFSVANNASPNRWLAFPFMGFMVKTIILIPVFIEAFFLGIGALVLLVINCFVVLFTGKYWDVAYRYFLGMMRFWAKISLYFFGIVDKFPGFSLTTNGWFELTIAKPEHPNRWFAIPLFGFLARVIVLIPYLIFTDVMQRGAGFAMFLSWFVVLFKGRLPESFYEFEKDSLRVSFAANSYMVGFSEQYPSFAISMDHQTAKILLIIVGALLTFGQIKNTVEDAKHPQPTYRQHYEYRNNMYPPGQNPQMHYKTY